MTAPATSFWRVAGMTYLQYVNRAATSVRSALKEPMKSKLTSGSSFSYNAATWEGGVQGVKTEITTLGKAG
eukprot:CAMPEP_0176128946 /NCGR_PEP_ID=MMETSP0120_2-20121206/65178_1 /TAXON_ID=160619 /ORGANISM="Kryptoperidinium foliaceum, Strain CCMP 1326" /LENGTH=70 /DNA_ID=CAMNT_0017464089 /DNA_START=62 /DNA_END=270 /DNA_ORIENTATION=+